VAHCCEGGDRPRCCDVALSLCRASGHFNGRGNAEVETLPVEHRVRQGEQLRLRRDDIDLAAGVVKVRRQPATAASAHLKTVAASRDIPLPESLVRRLKEHRLASRHSLDDDFVFCAASGEPRGHRNIRQGALASVARPANASEAPGGPQNRVSPSPPR
jgi:integrase